MLVGQFLNEKKRPSHEYLFTPHSCLCQFVFYRNQIPRHCSAAADCSFMGCGEISYLIVTISGT